MSATTYKKIELVGTSATSFDDAANNAVKRAAATTRGLAWFEVTELRGAVKDGAVAEYQVTLKIGLHVDEANG